MWERTLLDILDKYGAKATSLAKASIPDVFRKALKIP
jgi:hypothetical protein